MDIREGQLQGGRAHIELGEDFLGVVTITAEHPLKVFVQPTADYHGIYVVKGVSGFDVVELGGGASDATFDYRVVAPRKGYRGARLPGVDEPRPDLQHARPGLLNEGHQSDPETDRRLFKSRSER